MPLMRWTTVNYSWHCWSLYSLYSGVTVSWDGFMDQLKGSETKQS